MANLIAYIPTLNRRHLDWFKRYPGSKLFLISQEEAEELLPRLARNMAALPSNLVASMISSEQFVRQVGVLSRNWVEDSDYPNLESPMWNEWILPDEDVSHLFAEKYLIPAGCSCTFEMIWARYDMTAVKKNQPVISDVEISTREFDRELMSKAVSVSEHSPDWWRQIGAVAVTSDGLVTVARCNIYMPNEYETYIFGDPGLNRDAGQKGKYTVLHAEEAIVTHCARHGIALEDSRVYVTTFPCERCARQLADVGVKEVFFQEGFSSLNAQEVLRTHEVRIVRVGATPGLE